MLSQLRIYFLAEMALLILKHHFFTHLQHGLVFRRVVVAATVHQVIDCVLRNTGGHRINGIKTITKLTAVLLGQFQTQQFFCPNVDFHSRVLVVEQPVIKLTKVPSQNVRLLCHHANDGRVSRAFNTGVKDLPQVLI